MHAWLSAYMPASITMHTVHTSRLSAPMSPLPLSPRELEVLVLLCQGVDTNLDIAAVLVLSPLTIEWHVKKLMNKLSVSSRAQLVARGYMSGLVA
jgi:DNA-binding NarL/FixJ family response regulator